MPNKDFSEYVSLKDVKENYIASKDDIIYTRTGQVGLVYTGIEGCVHNNCFKVHYDKKKFDKTFVYYLLKQRRIFLYANSVSAGSVQKDLNHPAFKSCIIAFPRLSEQQSIASILSALDDKIELNQQMNKTLEEIGQAIFKNWFVDFEFPNEQGKPYKSSGGEMVESELGMIPKGWKVGKLGEYAHVIKGVSYRSEELKESNKALVTLKSMNRGGGLNKNGFKEYTGEYKKEQEIIDGDIVVAYTDLTQKAEVIGRPAIVRKISKYEAIIASLDLAIIRPRDERVNNSFLYYLLYSDDFQNHVRGFTNGTTVLHLSSKAVPEYSFVTPNKPLILKFGESIERLLNKKKESEAETENLILIRDSLLPKLMSGKIRVPVGVKT